jgi:hypothetical protein
MASFQRWSMAVTGREHQLDEGSTKPTSRSATSVFCRVVRTRTDGHNLPFSERGDRRWNGCNPLKPDGRAAHANRPKSTIRPSWCDLPQIATYLTTTFIAYNSACHYPGLQPDTSVCVEQTTKSVLAISILRIAKRKLRHSMRIRTITRSHLLNLSKTFTAI